MSFRNFKQWVIQEKTDIFGFDKERTALKTVQDENPINPINSEIIMSELNRWSIGTKKPAMLFQDTIKWGDNIPGALRMDVSPLGSYKSIIRRMSTDLEGNNVWVCKKIIPFIENEHNKNEVSYAVKAYEHLTKIDESPMDSANNEYKELEQLTVSMASRARRDAPQVLIFEGIKKMNENRYTIHFSYRGHGLEAPGSRRCEQFNIDMMYSPKTGMIRSSGYEISSPTRQHKWEIQPSEWDELFTPSQPREEIVEIIMTVLSTY